MLFEESRRTTRIAGVERDVARSDHGEHVRQREARRQHRDRGLELGTALVDPTTEQPHHVARAGANAELRDDVAAIERFAQQRLTLPRVLAPLAEIE